MTTFLWADTSFLYALFVVHDQHHRQARLIWRSCMEKRITSVTSNLVISELGTLLSQRFGHATALNKVSLALDSTILMRIYVDREIESNALAWWRRFHDQCFSFPDCVSFELMRRTGIRQALSFDCDFAIAGFEMVKSPYQL